MQFLDSASIGEAAKGDSGDSTSSALQTDLQRVEWQNISGVFTAKCIKKSSPRINKQSKQNKGPQSPSTSTKHGKEAVEYQEDEGKKK